MSIPAISEFRQRRIRCPQPRRILLYSHDTFGLGHIRRCLAIARNLRHCPANIIIITGSILAGRFKVPERIDFVRVPGMRKITNEEYLPVSMKLDPGEVLEIRKRIIQATAAAFLPDFFIVDKAPMGLKREVMDTLHWLREEYPQCKTVLGLRDIMDDPESTVEEWTSKGIYDVMRTLYDEIWVYGCSDFYDAVHEYRIPDDIASKTFFTGYIQRNVPSRDKILATRTSLKIGDNEKLILVTTGGGGDGHYAIDAFLSAFDPASGCKPQDIRGVVVTGPFVPEGRYQAIAARCSALGFSCLKFHHNMERLIGAADAVVSMGGYNTVCEIVSQRKPLLILPRTFPRREQIIRADMLCRKGYCDYLDPGDLTPRILRERIMNLLDNSAPYRDKMSSFPFTGLDFMRNRIASWDTGSQWTTMAAGLE
ncbi:MAG: glycosyltransferase [Syntrophobacteraceae bacterium]